MTSYGSINNKSPLLSPRGKSSQHGVHNHHTAQDGALKAAVFGFSDGLCTNVNVILAMFAAMQGAGHAGSSLAASTRHILSLTGLCGMLGGASSMACGEWLSASAEAEATKAELKKEKWHHEMIPEKESSDMKDMMLESGLSKDTAEKICKDLDQLPLEQRVAFHARFELGIEEEELTVMATMKNAAFMWVSFAVGAVIPLLPWLVAPVNTNLNMLFALTIVVTVIAMMVTSALQTRESGASVMSMGMLKTTARQLVVVFLAVGVTVGLNLLLLGTVGGAN